MSEHSLFLDYNDGSNSEDGKFAVIVNSCDGIEDYLEDYEGYPFIITKKKLDDNSSSEVINRDDLTSIYISAIDGVMHIGTVEPLDLDDPITVSALKFANNIMSNFYGDDTDVSTDSSGDASGAS